MALATGAGLYFYQQASTDPATVRSHMARAGKAACFEDARADSRNVLIPDAKLRAFCACTLDTAVAAMSDTDARAAAIHTMAMSTAMHTKLHEANRNCRGQLAN